MVMFNCHVSVGGVLVLVSCFVVVVVVAADGVIV